MGNGPLVPAVRRDSTSPDGRELPQSRPKDRVDMDTSAPEVQQPPAIIANGPVITAHQPDDYSAASRPIQFMNAAKKKGKEPASPVQPS